MDRRSLLPLAAAIGHNVVWTSVLDESTSDYCRAMHGRAYGDGWTEPPPAHHNCRSTLALVPDDVSVSSPQPAAA